MLREHAHENSGTPEMLEQFRRCARTHQPEQGRAADNRNPCAGKNCIEPCGARRQSPPRVIHPCEIGERFASDRKCRPRHRPWTEPRRDPSRQLRSSQSETEPDACEPEKFAERTQHYDGLPLTSLARLIAGGPTSMKAS